MRTWVGLGLVALACGVGCGDDETSATDTTGSGASGATGGVGNSGNTGGAGATGGGGDGGVGASGGGGGGGAPPFETPVPFAVPLSAAGPDQLQAVTAADDAGNFLAAGFAAAAVGGDRLLTVVKLGPTGPDATFGTGGVLTTALVFAGGADEVDIATQSDGKIILTATVASATIPGDRDIAVTRLNADGSTDTTFGTDGVTIVNPNDAHDNGTMLVGIDASRDVTIDGDDDIFIHAVSRGVGTASGGGPRTDTDFTVAKLTADGALDTTFGTSGFHRLDIQEANATSRGIKALADGSIVGSGYANTPDLGTVQVVLYKLTPAGALDTAFATNGLYHEAILATQTEIYNFAVHGDQVVTAGYGRNTGDVNQYVSLRFHADTGVRDLTWGGAVNGAVLVDPSGTMLSSNARNAVGLPGGQTIIVGSTGPANMPEQDAVMVVLDETGNLDTDYGTGIHLFKLGNDGNDQFWGNAVSGDYVALVGYQGGGSTQTETTNDDAFGVVFEIQ